MTATTANIVPGAPTPALSADDLAHWAEEALTLPRFRAWVAERAALRPDGDSIVGVCAVPSLCPIATYLHSLIPHARADVFALSAIMWPEVGQSVDVPLSSWAIRFVRDVDRLIDIDHNITAAQALAILDRIAADDAALAALLEGRNA